MKQNAVILLNFVLFAHYEYSEEQNSHILKYVKNPEPHSYYKNIGDYSNPIKDPKPATNYANLFKYKKQEEELFICEKCHAPFSLFDELEVHTLTEHFDDGSTTKSTSEKPTSEPMITSEPTEEAVPNIISTPMETDDKK